MKISILISICSAFVLAYMLAPSDLILEIVLGLEAAFVCGLLIFIITRFKSFRETPIHMKRIMLGLVCLLSAIGVHWFNFFVLK
jgi:hypothetical protein